MIKLTIDNLLCNDKNFGLDSLSKIQKIILINDGTLTPILEALVSEQISVKRLNEKVAPRDESCKAMKISKDNFIVRREVTLFGMKTGSNYLHADTVIVPERLPTPVHDMLLTTNTPIGKVWDFFKIETYKELICWGKCDADKTAKYFDMRNDGGMLFRTYVVYIDREPAMKITEKFPSHYFIGS